ncbi:P-loop containing nucleoside triphosphate hydrolase protein [Mycena crocata]|nr:P-loop containing nucleoside triphosphate hydrolase protein [Mycena crocata]
MQPFAMEKDIPRKQSSIPQDDLWAHDDLTTDRAARAATSTTLLQHPLTPSKRDNRGTKESPVAGTGLLNKTGRDTQRRERENVIPRALTTPTKRSYSGNTAGSDAKRPRLSTCTPSKTSVTTIGGATVTVHAAVPAITLPQTRVTLPDYLLRIPGGLAAEQQEIVKAAETHDIRLCAPPGTGKTTIGEAIVAANANVPTMTLTRTRALSEAIQQRCGLRGFTHATACTLSALACKLYNGHNVYGVGLEFLWEKGITATWTGEKVPGLVILEEFQECTPIFYRLILVFIRLLTRLRVGQPPPSIMAFGHSSTALFTSLDGGDPRYLDFARDLLNFGRPWKELKLTTSYRTSLSNADFVNGILRPDKYQIVGTHEAGAVPKYYYLDLQNGDSMAKMAKYVAGVITAFGADRCAVLVPSLKSRHLVTFLNVLSDAGLDVMRPLSDGIPLKPDLFTGKVAVATYHQFQGIERDLIVLFGFNTYVDFYRQPPPERAPGPLISAIMRASKSVIFIHHHGGPPLNFLHWDELPLYSERLSFPPGLNPSSASSYQTARLFPKEIAVSDLTQSMSIDFLDGIANKYLRVVKVGRLPLSSHISPSDTVTTDKVRYHQDYVGDVNSISITAAFEYSIHGTMRTLNVIDLCEEGFPTAAAEQARWICRRAIQYQDERSRSKQRPKAMASHPHDWMDICIPRGVAVLRNNFSSQEELHFESPFKGHPFTVGVHSTILVGRADIVATTPESTSITEIKLVVSLTAHHKIQAILYAYMYATEREEAVLPGAYLLNLSDGTKLRIESTVQEVKDMATEILEIRCLPRNNLSTGDFLAQCKEIWSKVYDSNN